MLKELNDVINYIENHLTDDLSLETISAYAGVSDYHFRQIFFYIAGITLHDYIKNRKLSEANNDLLEGESVTNVAFKYGYESLDGFTRAFKKWNGHLPSEIAAKKISKSFPKLSFIITVKGGAIMNYRIEDKPTFQLAGVSKRVNMQFKGVNQEIEELANSISEEQKKEMHNLQDIAPFEIVNASYDADAGFVKEEGKLTHLIGVLTTNNQISHQLDQVTVEACTWAVFPNEGPFPSTLQETMAKTHAEWLPTSNYEVLDMPSFSFTKMDEEKQNYAYSEIWLPVQKKRND